MRHFNSLLQQIIIEEMSIVQYEISLLFLFAVNQMFTFRFFFQWIRSSIRKARSRIKFTRLWIINECPSARIPTYLLIWFESYDTNVLRLFMPLMNCNQPQRLWESVTSSRSVYRILNHYLWKDFRKKALYAFECVAVASIESST